MSSQDINLSANNNYVTVDLFNAHMARLEALMEKNHALIRADIADLKTELKQDIVNVRTELKQDIANVRTELKQDIADLRTELKQDIANVRSEMGDMKTELKAEISALEHKVAVNGAKIDGLYHWNYWIIAVFAVILIVPRVSEGLNMFFKSLGEVLISLFSKNKAA